MAKLVLEDLTKDFGKVRAVDHMNLQVEDGEFVVIVGPSGAGKTTTLKLIAGVEQASTGMIYIGDQLVNAVEPHKRNVAMAFESYALYPHFTVFQNLAFPLRAPNRRVEQAEIDRRVRAVAELLGIQTLFDRLPRMLSNGQKQRVALGRAIIHEPEVLLLDEPISHLDAKLRHRMRAEFKALESAIKSTTIYVTHDYLEALSLGDRLVVLNKGVIEQIGRPAEVYSNPINTFVAQLLGHPRINLVECQITDSDGRMQLRSTTGEIQLDVPDPLRDPINRRRLDRVLLGVRPLDIRVAENEAQSGGAFGAAVYVYERLGTKGILTASTGEHKLEVLTPIEMDFQIDAPVRLAIDSDNILIFDAVTRTNILFD